LGAKPLGRRQGSAQDEISKKKEQKRGRGSQKTDEGKEEFWRVFIFYLALQTLTPPPGTVLDRQRHNAGEEPGWVVPGKTG